MSQDRYRLGYHIAPKTGWLNDPNGLCQFRGTYHAFFQFNPLWPKLDTKYWRHFTSTDLLHWKDNGTSLVTDIAEDRNGVFSGSACVRRGAASDGGDLMCLYYTGNVVNKNDPEAGIDFVHTGREANEILVTSEDGFNFSEKKVLLRNADYPDVCTLHVRDPKVWEQNGRMWMLLGARDHSDEGMVLLYGSDDGSTWRIKSQVYSQNKFGYMWECPNIVQIDGRDFLAVCPQGLPDEVDRWQNLWQAGYFPLPGSILDTVLVDETTFVEWDLGYDFYAPQVFVDDAGRTILIGWMGTFEDNRTSSPEGMPWAHCLTVPRLLTVGDDGLLRQNPVSELEAGRHLPPVWLLDLARYDERLVVVRDVAHVPRVAQGEGLVEDLLSSPVDYLLFRYPASWLFSAHQPVIIPQSARLDRRVSLACGIEAGLLPLQTTWSFAARSPSASRSLDGYNT